MKMDAFLFYAKAQKMPNILTLDFCILLCVFA